MTTREQYMHVELLEAAKDVINYYTWDYGCDCVSCAAMQRLSEAVDASDAHRMQQLESDDGK